MTPPIYTMINGTMSRDKEMIAYGGKIVERNYFFGVFRTSAAGKKLLK